METTLESFQGLISSSSSSWLSSISMVALLFVVIVGAAAIVVWSFIIPPRNQNKNQTKQQQDDDPIPIINDIPIIPGATWYGGHLHMLQEPDFQKAQRAWSYDHANDQGRCCFYFGLGKTKPSLSVHHCDDVQLLLKATAHKSRVSILSQHFQQLFGDQNVFMLNGKDWRNQYNRIFKALHPVKKKRSGNSNEHHSHQDAFRRATQRMMDAIPFVRDNDKDEMMYQSPDLTLLLKALTLDCFGQAALYTDFQTCEKLLWNQQPQDKDTETDNNNTSSSSCLDIGPAFEFLSRDIMRRFMTRDILLPWSYCYGWPTPANRAFAKHKQTVLGFLRNIIAQRRELVADEQHEALPTDLLSGFLEYFQDKDQQQEKELDLIIAQCMLVLLFAGYETSSVTLSYVIYELARNPHVMEKCRQEILEQEVPAEIEARNHSETNNNNNTSRSRSATTTHHVYLEAVIKETLRLYPPAISTTRSAERDIELPAVPGRAMDDKSKVVVVPKGTYLYIPIWSIHRDERHFDNPNEFRPERWVKQREEEEEEEQQQQQQQQQQASRWEPRDDVNHKAWIPFSAGARMCPGQRFAMQELTTILTVLLPAVTLDPPPADYVLEPSREGFIQAPKGGIPITIRKIQQRTNSTTTSSKRAVGRA